MKLYEIHEVAQLTGLAAARLRAWERRYEVVRPLRMPNGYRGYSSQQVALLRAFARLIGEGERIGAGKFITSAPTCRWNRWPRRPGSLPPKQSH